MPESYKTLKQKTTARLVEKKSEFIAHAAPVTTDDAATLFLEEVRAQHRTASHNVFAYSLREGARQRYSDDGEPAKTAGLPVLDIITHSQIVDCIIVVTRYFGGTLLGTGGLVRAYSGAAAAVLQAAEIVTVQRCVTITLVTEYPLYEQASRLIGSAGAVLDAPVFTDVVTLTATMPDGTQQTLLPALNELFRGNLNVHVSDAFYTPF